MNTLATFLVNASIELISKNAVITVRNACDIKYTMHDGSTITVKANDKRNAS